MSQYFFRTNSGEQITLGEKPNLIKVKIHDDTPAPTPASLIVDYTADLFRKYGLDHEPSKTEYDTIAAAICQSDVLHWFSSVKKLCHQAYYQAKSSDGTGLTAYGKKVVASMRAAKKYAQRC